MQRLKILNIATGSAVLLAAMMSVITAVSAAEVRFFEPTSRTMSTATPQQLPELAAPQELESAPAKGPLRVVIPNIKKQKKNADTATAPTAAPIAAPANIASSPVARAPQTVTQNQIAPAPSTSVRPPASKFSKISDYSDYIVASAEDVWNNGVTMPDWNSIPLIRNLPRPNINFATLPSNWLLPSNSSNASLNALSPAAGEPEKPLLASDSAGVVVPTIITSNADASEPVPSLSGQSKAIANKIPVVDDRAKKEPARIVGIDHTKDNPNGLGSGEVAVSAKAASMGLKMEATRPKIDPAYELERAYNALLAGKSEDALHIYEDILTNDPKNKDALFGLASTYHRVGQIDMARTLYGKLLAIDPKNRDGLNNFLVLLADEAPQEALVQMEKLETQNPGFSPIPAQMAIIYQKLGDQDRAVDKMYRALAITPENITYRYNLAIMLDKNGKYEDAGKLYTQILDSHAKGENIPGDATKIQQRLTFIRSNSSIQ